MFKLTNLREDSLLRLTVTADNLVEDKLTGKRVPCTAQRASSPVKWLGRTEDDEVIINLGSGKVILSGRFLTCQCAGETLGYLSGNFASNEPLASPFAILSGNTWEFIAKTEDDVNWKVIRDAFIAAYPDSKGKVAKPESASLPVAYADATVIANITMAIALYGKSGLLRYLDTATPKPTQLGDDAVTSDTTCYAYRIDADGISCGIASNNKTGKVTYAAHVRLADLATVPCTPEGESTDDESED